MKAILTGIQGNTKCSLELLDLSVSSYSVIYHSKQCVVCVMCACMYTVAMTTHLAVYQEHLNCSLLYDEAASPTFREAYT